MRKPVAVGMLLKKVQSFSSFFSHLLPHTSSSSVRDYFSRRTLIFKIKKSNEDWAVTGGSQNKWEAGFGVFLFFNHQNHFFYPSVISMQRLRLAWKDGWRQHCSCDVALDLWDDPVQVHYSLWFIKLCILSFGEVTPLLSEQLCVCRSFLIARILF